MTKATDGSGVDYGAMDPTKVAAQHAGLATARHLERFGYREVTWSRGESVYLIEGNDHYLGMVVEGLGTKNLVADAMWAGHGKHFYDKIGRDAVAMILNDMITLGVLPMVVGQYLAAGEGRWFHNEERVKSLRTGWTSACDDAGAAYGCGETPTLRDIIYPTTVDLAGASMGIIKPKDRLMDPHNIQHGDVIVMLCSSGVHSNGLTGMRDLADLISYSEEVPGDGRMFGEVILDPTPIYVPIIEDILDAGIRPHYGVNITGHGWRKLMRWVDPFVYRITRIPEPQPIFRFIQERTGKTTENMYDSLNMGAGFALFVHPSNAQRVIDLASRYGIEAGAVGVIEKDGNNKQVIIEPLDITFEADTLGVR